MSSRHSWRTDIEDYAPLIGEDATERILRKAKRLRGLRVLHLSSTFYGGGVAELLSSATLLFRSLGIRADWRLIQGSPDFFNVTKKLHNALQGGPINLTELKKEVYEEVLFQNATRLDMEYDFVIVHDPQPLPMINHYRRTCPWVWRCHLDLSQPDPETWAYLRGFVDGYDAVVVSLPEYRREMAPPQVAIMPAINPFALKNRDLDDAEVRDRLEHYRIPDDRPIVAQISRFDRWKDPEGVIAAFRRARREVDATLVLLGNVAADDPEGQEVFESLLRHKSSEEDAARRIVELLRDAGRRRELGRAARETVRRRFLLTRLVEQHLGLYDAFEPKFRPDPDRLERIAALAAPS
ncbi:MAG: glycosyl transferase family 1 [Pseudomonadota bacterium]